MNKQKIKEKRKHPRVYQPLIAAYKSSKSKSPAKVTQISNISEGGLAFKSDTQFKRGENLDLLIRLPFANQAIKARGRVAGSYKAAEDLFIITRVVFTNISMAAKKQLKGNIKKIKGKKG